MVLPLFLGFMDFYRLDNHEIFPQVDAQGNYTEEFVSIPVDAFNSDGIADPTKYVHRTKEEYELERNDRR